MRAAVQPGRWLGQSPAGLVGSSSACKTGLNPAKTKKRN